METKNIRTRFNLLQGKKLQLEQDLVKTSKEIKRLKKDYINHEQAREIIKFVGTETQQQLRFHISDITSMALESIFNDPYKLNVNFVERRGKIECDLKFERNNSLIKPLEASGGGVVDIASFALRIASWSMSNPRTRNCILLDEPTKHLSEELREKASIMIKEISKRLGIQFIIISHDPVLATSADRVFETTIKNKISKIKRL